MTENAIDVGDRKQLFIDETWFAGGRGMSLCVNGRTRSRKAGRPSRQRTARVIAPWSPEREQERIPAGHIANSRSASTPYVTIRWRGDG